MDIGLPRAARYAEFWPLYLREHARPATRYTHYAGTTAGLACLGLALATGRGRYIPLGLIAAYGAAWAAVSPRPRVPWLRSSMSLLSPRSATMRSRSSRSSAMPS